MPFYQHYALQESNPWFFLMQNMWSNWDHPRETIRSTNFKWKRKSLFIFILLRVLPSISVHHKSHSLIEAKRAFLRFASRWVQEAKVPSVLWNLLGFLLLKLFDFHVPGAQELWCIIMIGSCQNMKRTNHIKVEIVQYKFVVFMPLEIE